MKESIVGDDSVAELSKERLRLWLVLLKTSRRVETRLRENLRVTFGSTLPRFDVLAALSRYAAGLRMCELSSELRVSNGNVTGIVDRLVNEGLVTRIGVPGDRRASLVKLSTKGQQEFDRQAQAHEQWINELLGDFDAPDTAELLALLTVVSSEAKSGVPMDREPPGDDTNAVKLASMATAGVQNCEQDKSGQLA